jgi:hypothetical protein
VTSSPVIVKYQPGHFGELLALWKQHFGSWSADRLQQRWSWQYEENPFCAERPPIQLVVEDQGRVFGHISGSPVPMLLNGNRTIALASSGLVVAPSHSWMAVRLVASLTKSPPVLGRAAESTIYRLFDRAGATPIAASEKRFIFPLRYNSHLSIVLRWRVPAALGSLVTPTAVAPAAALWRPRDKPAVKRLPRRTSKTSDIFQLLKFTDDYSELWRRVRDRWSCSIDKDARYMNWRYLACPTLHPVCLGLNDKSGLLRAIAVGIVCVGLDRFQRPAGISGELAELIADDPADPAVEELLLHVMRALDRKRVDAVESTSLHPSLHPLLERVGFVKENSELYRVMLATKDGIESEDSWYHTAADSDALYSPGL